MRLILVNRTGEIVGVGQMTESAGYGVQPDDALHFHHGALYQESPELHVRVVRKRFAFTQNVTKAQPELFLTVEILENP